MADQQTVPPIPPKEPIVSEQALYLNQVSLYRNTLAFGGTRNPTAIWASMSYNEPWAMAYYRELEEKDEDVSNGLESLKLSVLKRNRILLPACESDSKAVDVMEFVKAQLMKVNFDQVLDCVLDSLGYGFSVQELMFDVSAGQASLSEIVDAPQELFLFGNRFRPQIGQLQYLSQPFATEGQHVPEEKFLIMSYRARAGNRMGRPLLKSVFWPSWFKRNIQRLWTQFAEKGPGTAVVYYNDPNSDIEKQQAANIAQAVIDNVAIAVPQSFKMEVELLKVARSQDPAVYQNFFQAMQYSIARRILGETLTSFGGENGKGTQALGAVHDDTLEARSIAICRALESVVCNQLIRRLVLWNFGPKAPIPTWSVETTAGEDLAKRLGIDTGLQRMGKQFTAGYVADRYDVPLVSGEEPEEADTVLTPVLGVAPASVPAAADDTVKPDFSEAQAHKEMGEFDRLMNELRADSAQIMRQRVEEIVSQATPVVKP